MVTRRFRAALALALATGLTALTTSCEKTPLLAPTGSTITLTAPVTVLAANGSTTIVAQVLEAAGTAPHSGTHVIFSTTLGQIVPPDAETDSGGRVAVAFSPMGNNGTATITAVSGGATTGTNGALKIAVGTAAASSIVVGANPSTVPATGGSSVISAFVLDVNANPLPGAQVTFTTTAGALSSALVTTDSNGSASTILTTTQQATVTARVGANGSTSSPSTPTSPTTPSTSGTQSNSVTVNISSGPQILITPPTTAPTKGLPANFTFVVTAGAQNPSAIRNVVVDWGDGQILPLGNFTGSQVVPHTFQRDGTYVINATVTDSNGVVGTSVTTVFVTPAVQAGINISSSPVPARVNTLTTFTIQITVPTGVGITNTVIDYGDGFRDNLGGGATQTARHTYTTQGAFTVTVSVTDTSGQTSIGNTTVSVGQ